MRSHKTLRLVAPLLAWGLVLTACGGDTSTSHNEQDVAFATEMIPHHAQAVQMSEIALDNAGSQRVKRLAEDIRAAQGPEIEQLSSWLEDWDEEVPEADGMGAMEGMGDMEGMPGMMSPAEMDDLEAASGADFDRMFLTMMIEHHEGAIAMAQTEQQDGSYADAVELAATIEETQSAEIEAMRELLAAG